MYTALELLSKLGTIFDTDFEGASRIYNEQPFLNKTNPATEPQRTPKKYCTWVQQK